MICSASGLVTGPICCAGAKCDDECTYIMRKSPRLFLQLCRVFIFYRHPGMFQVGIFLKELEDADLKHVSMTRWGEDRQKRGPAFSWVWLYSHPGLPFFRDG